MLVFEPETPKVEGEKVGAAADSFDDDDVAEPKFAFCGNVCCPNAVAGCCGLKPKEGVLLAVLAWAKGCADVWACGRLCVGRIALAPEARPSTTSALLYVPRLASTSKVLKGFGSGLFSLMVAFR